MRYNRSVTASAVLLCAGLGTRLRPLTNVLPKPLVPLGDRALVGHAVAQLQAAAVTDFTFNAHHLSHLVESFVGALAETFPDERFRCVIESELLGTAGGLRGAARGQEHLLLWNGDIYAPDLDVAELLERARGNDPVLVVAPSAGFGTIGVGPAGEVVGLRGRGFGVERSRADYVGIAVLPRRFVESLPAQGCLVGDGLMPWLAEGERVSTFEYSGHWSDGGTLAQYLDQNQRWLERHQPVGDEQSYVAEAVTRGADVTLRHCVVGQGATLRGPGIFTRCVLWPGATARAPLSNAVVLPDGSVVE